MLEKYVIVGPDDHNQLATFWNTDLGWVGIEDATRYDERILTAPLPRETLYLMDIQDHIELTPLPGWGHN